jgi:hypothetical protein
MAVSGRRSTVALSWFVRVVINSLAASVLAGARIALAVLLSLVSGSVAISMPVAVRGGCRVAMPGRRTAAVAVAPTVSLREGGARRQSQKHSQRHHLQHSRTHTTPPNPLL